MPLFNSAINQSPRSGWSWLAKVLTRVLACVATCMVVASAIAQAVPSPAVATPAATPANTVSEVAVSAAIVKLKQDPNLAPERKSRMLHWRQDDSKDNDSSDSRWPRWLRWLRWIGDFFMWLADISRLLLWTVVGVLSAILVLFLLRIFKRTDIKRTIHAALAPTHVRELDIRPESLPDDIGDAAWQLWNQGEQRAALALLYRGLLSRLVHVHGVPVRESSTESECLALAQTRLTVAANNYCSLLLSIWLQAVYGGTTPTTQQVQTLCTDFASALAPTVSIAPSKIVASAAA